MQVRDELRAADAPQPPAEGNGAAQTEKGGWIERG